MSFVSAALWYLGGILSFLFIARAIKYYHLIEFTHKINVSILLLLREKEKELSPTNEWKEDIIQKIIHTYPKEWHKIMKFSNWNQAMKWLDKIEEKDE